MPWALDPQEILQIAQEAVRQRGYVTYPDYEDALRQAIMDGRLPRLMPDGNTIISEKSCWRATSDEGFADSHDFTHMVQSHLKPLKG